MRTKPKKSRQQVVPDGRLRLALDEFLSRAARRSHPEGEWQEGLWRPSPQERQACCDAIRPSTANRQALESHCRSQAHVAALFGVDPVDLKTAIREERKEALRAPGDARPEQARVLNEEGNRVSLLLRELIVRRLRKAAGRATPAIERLRRIEAEEELTPALANAREAAEGLLEAIGVAELMEEALQRLNELVGSSKGKNSARPAASDRAERGDLIEEAAPRRFDKAAVRAA